MILFSIERQSITSIRTKFTLQYLISYFISSKFISKLKVRNVLDAYTHYKATVFDANTRRNINVTHHCHTQNIKISQHDN